MKKIIILIFVFLISLYTTYAIESLVCVPTEVNLGGSISCEADLASGASEKNQPENMTFYNDSTQTIQIADCSFAGTTENAPDPQNLVHTCTIPTDGTNVTNVIVNFSLTSLGTSIATFFNITAITTTQLIIDDINIETPILIGKQTGARWTVSDATTGKGILGAQCNGDILQLIGGNLVPIAGSTVGIGSPISKYAGHALTSFTPSINVLEEDTSYIVEIRCDCVPENTACMDDDGTVVVNRTSLTGLLGIGTTTIRTSKWLDVNTITDKLLYEMKQELFVCANVTNVNGTNRVPMEITHQIRCSKGEDLDSDLDRVLVMSDDAKPDERGINVNTTQMQCKRFMIPEAKYLQGRNSVCYASTEVTVLDDERNPIVSYHTTSSDFNITSNTLNLNPDWERKSDYVFESIINLSDVRFANLNGTNMGNIDIRLSRLNPETLDSTEQYIIPNVDFNAMLNTKFVKNITVINKTGNDVTWALEILEDGDMEIELRDVPLTPSAWFNVTLTLNSFEERQTEALENISTKTGTFHFDVDCPTIVEKDAICTITAFIESGEVEKEVDFDCYIDDGLSSLNFNQMVTSTPYIVDKTFATEGLGLTFSSHTLTCKANYYNFGSRQDTFSDTFIYRKKTSGVALEEIRKILEEAEEGTKKLIEEGVEIIKQNKGLAVIVLFLGIFLVHRRDVIKELIGEYRDERRRRRIINRLFRRR